MTDDEPTVVFIVPPIDDNLTPAQKNALAIRNQCSIEGTCPACGCQAELHMDPDHPNVGHLLFIHENHCPVARDNE